MSEPSAACTAIDSSGPMNRSEPSRYERKATPRSEISITPPLAPDAAAAALDLVGDVAVCEREDLKAARVRDDRPLPADELVQAAELGDPLGAGG